MPSMTHAHRAPFHVRVAQDWYIRRSPRATTVPQTREKREGESLQLHTQVGRTGETV